MLIDFKPNNYNGNYKDPILKIRCWGDGGCWYEANAIKSYWERGLFMG
jgi:hypothetical protein